MTQRDTGTVHAVVVNAAGSYVKSATATGGSIIGNSLIIPFTLGEGGGGGGISVEDAADFSETGGQVAITSNGVTNTYTYTAADLDTDTITLDGGLLQTIEEGDRVEVSPRATERQAMVVLADSEDSIMARIPDYMSTSLTEGVREEGAREVVNVTLVNGEWIVTDMPGTSAGLRSEAYEPGFEGWGIDELGVQFPSVNVISDLGADSLTARQFTLDGRDMEGEVLAGLPLGLLSKSEATIGTNSANVTNVETIIFQWNAGDVTTGRMFQLAARGHIQGSVTGDEFEVLLRYTIAGANPTTGSNILASSKVRVDTESGNPRPYDITAVFNPASSGEFRVALCLVRVAGTGNAYVMCDDVTRQPEFMLYDEGAIAVTAPPSQVSKASGSPDPDQTATYTKSWTATASASYDGGVPGQKREGAENTTACWQGFDFNPVHGHMKSVVCFNDADIRAQLAGSTIVSVKVALRVGYSANSTGLDIKVNRHNVSTPPNTYNGELTALIATRNNSVAGSTYTITLPNGFAESLRDGTARGIGFIAPTGDATDQQYKGWISGANTSYAPKLTITYVK